MSKVLSRRQFLGGAAAASFVARESLPAGLARRLTLRSQINLAVIGCNSRGMTLVRAFGRERDVRIGYVCDVDVDNVGRAAAQAVDVQHWMPRMVTDFRYVLDDPTVDAVAIATPNHWHAPLAILACSAGKHVYVEKPASQNPREGELMVAAARKYQRLVQMGNQRRSWLGIQEAIERVRGGFIGRVYYARAWYANSRGSIGTGQPAPVPSRLNYDLWQGPAPRRDYRDNLIHYNWHWFWHWGNGEVGNNGVHTIDVCRWGLGVDYPERVSSTGGRYHWVDDQQTPDTNVVSFEFKDGKSICWEGLSCNAFGKNGTSLGVTFHGEDGTLFVRGNTYQVYDLNGQLIPLSPPAAGGQPGFDVDSDHVRNFLNSILGLDQLNSEIEEAQRSTLLTHLANIAYRTGRSLECDPESGRILDDEEAMTLWGREYAPGWEPRV